MTALRRVTSVARRYILDAIALAGLGLLAYGLGQYSSPLLPIVLGLGLLASVRFGSR